MALAAGGVEECKREREQRRRIVWAAGKEWAVEIGRLSAGTVWSSMWAAGRLGAQSKRARPGGIESAATGQSTLWWRGEQQAREQIDCLAGSVECECVSW